jgi:REP element-mobilizing transposase RayT
MKTLWLFGRALYEILRYEVIVRLRGSGRILSELKQQSIAAQPTSEEVEKAICNAVHLATCFYWKPVLWHRAYFMSTVGTVSLEVAKQYIAKQGTVEKPRRR